MLLLGIDVGTSSIKVAVVDADTQQCITTVQYPETETGIITLQHGWAEQSTPAPGGRIFKGDAAPDRACPGVN